MIRLQRLTSSNKYLPFIDGLRFFAILPVVLVHFVDFYESHTYKISDTDLYQKFHLNSIIGNSDNAVLLFFAISGFVLGLPFAKLFFYKEPSPTLKEFYTRRLTRLEPPYLLVLTGLMLMNVFVFHKSGLIEQLPHYFASFFYLHNIIYQAYPEINFVFWSLEIEVQFYLLAPLLAKVFSLETNKRRVLLVISILVFGIINQFTFLPFISLLNYLHYFLAGFLALDFYLNSDFKKTYVFDLAAIILLVLSWTGIFKYGVVLPFVLAGFIYFSSKASLFYKFISLKWISIIGGMCYTIYMIHQPVLAFFLNRVVGNELLTITVWGDFFIKFTSAMLFVLILSCLFFVFIERPCMRKDWYKKFFIFTSSSKIK